MDTYQQLPVWQKAMELAELIYQRTRRFPDDERSGLGGQLRRAAAALPYEVAISSMESGPAFLRGLRRTRRILRRLDIQVRLAEKLHCWRNSQCDQLRHRMRELEELLAAFFESIRDPA